MTLTDLEHLAKWSAMLASDSADPAIEDKAEAAWDAYAEAKHAKNLCLQYGCTVISEDHSYCPVHRPK
jgi:hypothetical protein